MSERVLREFEERANSTERTLTDLQDKITNLEYYNKETGVTLKMLIKKLHIVSEKLQDTYNTLYEHIG